MNYKTSLYIKISRRRLLVLPAALRDIFILSGCPITVPQLIGQPAFT
ncbi:hypothetical protein HMPREF1547_00837 [Blautia sp. KLE 1732]|nr:hypothetical protein HMPREF1547_00837 [Blautia sp. KLE 1732]